MTPYQIEQAEKDAESDAEWLLLLLLLFLNKKDKSGNVIVTFDSAKGRFYYKGKSVSVTQIRKYIAKIERSYGARLSNLAIQLEQDGITLNEWQRQFERNITAMHILSGALALGGIAVAARNAQIQGLIDEQIGFADQFTKSLRKKKAGTAAQIKARARSYVRAISSTFANAELEARKLVGRQMDARRVRRASESCKDCIKWARRGWVPIEEMPRIGILRCGIYCRCYIEYR